MFQQSLGLLDHGPPTVAKGGDIVMIAVERWVGVDEVYTLVWQLLEYIGVAGEVMALWGDLAAKRDALARLDCTVVLR